MTIYNEYCTLAQLRKSGEGAQLNMATTAGDPLLLSLIREVSADIDQMCNRTFAPYITTQYYDCYSGSPWGGMNNLYYSGGKAGDVFQSRTGGFAYARYLRVDNNDLLELTGLTNGDGTTIALTDVLLYPANSYPKQELRLKQSSGIAWLPDSDGNVEQVIPLNGIFGYHTDYLNAWRSAGTLATPLTTTGTSYTFSSGAGLQGGMLLKIADEFAYVSDVASTTATIERGVNGSTAAAHTTGTAVSYWQPIFTIQRVARMAVAANWNLRANPEGKQVSINGVTFQTPNSILQWCEHELEGAGLQRTGLG